MCLGGGGVDGRKGDGCRALLFGLLSSAASNFCIAMSYMRRADVGSSTRFVRPYTPQCVHACVSFLGTHSKVRRTLM